MQNRSSRFPVARAVSVGLATAMPFVLLILLTPGVRAAPPTLTIVSPANNAIIGNGLPVSILFITSDFNLTEPGTGGPGPNEGHAEVYVDGALFELTSQPTVVLSLSSGPHDIRLRLVTDNGTALKPDVSQSIQIMMTRGPAAGVPEIRITYPANGADRGPDTAVSFQLTNFALVPPGDPPSVPNEGHVEVFLDGTLYQELTVYESVHFSDLLTGDHTALLRLVDSAHQPLSPDVSASVLFHVAGSTVIDISPSLAVVNLILAGAVIAALYVPIRSAKR